MIAIDEEDVKTVLWKDNKCVRLASTYVGIESFKRFNHERMLTFYIKELMPKNEMSLKKKSF